MNQKGFFSDNLLNLLLCITLQPALPSTDHWSHLGPSESQGALGTVSTRSVIICHFTLMKNPKPPCPHSPLPLTVKTHHQVLPLPLSRCLSNHLILPTPTLMVKIQALLTHCSDPSNNSLSVSMPPRLLLPAATRSPR